MFAPALSAGSSIGNLTAQLFHIGGSEANLLILAGMTAFLTGITRSPFTSAILVIEMTNSHSVIFYIMISALVGSLIAKILARHPFYEHLKDQYLREVEQD
ncbi:MAG: chloride channel protein [Chitinophagaceae bacterium]